MANSFYPAPLPVPRRLETAAFTLCPLTPAHLNQDYAAVMASKEMLRVWSGSQWPRDDFTLADNLSDLQWHEQEHQTRIAFTYTILSPDEADCLGCLYIKPLQSWLQANPGLPFQAGPLDASTRFWIKTPCLADGLEEVVLMELQSWFATLWQFKHHSFHVRAADTRQVQLLENSPLAKLWTMQNSDRGGAFYFYGE